VRDRRSEHALRGVLPVVQVMNGVETELETEKRERDREHQR
jgi:hypothetical protein